MFSKREIEIIRLISEGYETKEIMEQLFISEDTVKTHRKNILRKSGCKNSAELVARSLSEGWI
jgi:DNA-binding CsgD family transcriptional regulator